MAKATSIRLDDKAERMLNIIKEAHKESQLTDTQILTKGLELQFEDAVIYLNNEKSGQFFNAIDRLLLDISPWAKSELRLLTTSIFSVLEVLGREDGETLESELGYFFLSLKPDQTYKINFNKERYIHVWETIKKSEVESRMVRGREKRVEDWDVLPAIIEKEIDENLSDLFNVWQTTVKM